MECVAPLMRRLLRFAALVIVVVSLFMVVTRSSVMSESDETKGHPRLRSAIPERILVVYPGWGKCGHDVEQTIQNGANVIAWSFGALRRAHQDDGKAEVLVQPDLECIRNVANKYTGVLHLLSFGGWNSPHPDGGVAPEEYYRAWAKLNESPENARDDGSLLFDGIDWDFEGNDNRSSPTNTISRETLDIMGKMSLLAKRNGYVASLAPAESYLDPRSSAGALYSRSLLHDDEAWEAEFSREQGALYSRPFFGYHGRNCWAYLLAAYGWEAFDFVSVQFYESYSHFGYDVQVAGIPHQQAIQDAASAYFDGWEVDFSSDEDPEVALLGLQSLNIPPEKFVFGVAALSGDLEAHLPSDSAPYAKIFTLDPTSSTAFRDAMRAMNSAGRAPRGFMFWCAEDEARSSSPFYMSRGLSDVLMMKAMTTGPSNRDDNDPSHHFGASDELVASSPSRIDYTATSDGNKHSIRQ